MCLDPIGQFHVTIEIMYFFLCGSRRLQFTVEVHILTLTWLCVFIHLSAILFCFQPYWEYVGCLGDCFYDRRDWLLCCLSETLTLFSVVWLVFPPLTWYWLADDVDDADLGPTWNTDGLRFSLIMWWWHGWRWSVSGWEQHAVMSSCHVISCPFIHCVRNVMEMRAKHKDVFLKKYSLKLGFMSAFVKAAAFALFDQPVVNAVIDEKEIVYHDYVDISIAVSTPKVPTSVFNEALPCWSVMSSVNCSEKAVKSIM